MSELLDPRPMILDLLQSDVEQNRERFDEETGRFLTGGGWAVTNQDLMYPLALLYLSEGNRYCGDESILDLAVRAGDAVRDFQYPDGTVEFVKIDGSTWGAIYMPWTMLHWLETYRLLESRLDTSRRERWAEGLELAYAGITRDLDDQEVHNIPVWNGAAAYRAGQVFDRPEWRNAGERMIARAVEKQHPLGYWEEHFGPTPSYNLVYVHALGLYHAYSGDASVIPALERAIPFHIDFTYPDGRIIETIDGRVKYHDHIPTAGYVGLQATPQGRRYVEFLLERQFEHRKDLPGNDEDVLKSGSLKTTSAHVGLEARIGAAFEYWVPGPTEPIRQDLPEYRVFAPGLATITRRGRWLCCMSGCTTPPVESRWGQDRQNMLSIWHDSHGLIIGGGNSKDQPAWSTFLVEKDDEVLFIPERARCEQVGDEDRCIYYLGDVSVEMKCVTDDDRLHLSWSDSGHVTVQLLLRFTEGMRIETECGEFDLSLGTPLELRSEACGDRLRFGGLEISVTRPFVLTWPVSPFNPYTKDGASPSVDSVAVLSISLSGGPAEMTICERETGGAGS